MTVRKLVDYTTVLVDSIDSESKEGALTIGELSHQGYELVGNPYREKNGKLVQAMAKYEDYHESMKKKKRLGIF